MITKQELKEVLQKYQFDEKQIDRILNKKIKTLLQRGNKDNIDAILKILLDGNDISRKSIEGCLSVLAQGKADEIEKIFKVLDKHEISKETIEGCLIVLAKGKANEIENIFKVLDEYEISKETIEGCLSVLAFGKANEIEKIFKLLDEHEISKETIEGCLIVLAQGKADEIEKIFKLLDKHEISKEAIEGCLSVLAFGKADEIEKIFKILEDNKIEKEQINNNLGFILLQDSKKIKNIFAEGILYLKRYMQLKGYYDRILNKIEIQNICKEKKVTESEFLKSIRGEFYQNVYQVTLKRKGGIYIGKSVPINESYISENTVIFLNLSKRVARNFGYKYHIRDISELESQVIEIIISKCGDVVYNLDWNPELLERAIYRKTYNYLKINLNAKEILQDFSTSEIERQVRFSEDLEKNGDELDLSGWKINEEQETILRNISVYLEEGYELSEAIANVATMLELDEEEILEEISKIKEQNNENEIRMGEVNELS